MAFLRAIVSEAGFDLVDHVFVCFVSVRVDSFCTAFVECVTFLVFICHLRFVSLVVHRECFAWSHLIFGDSTYMYQPENTTRVPMRNSILVALCAN